MFEFWLNQDQVQQLVSSVNILSNGTMQYNTCGIAILFKNVLDL